MKERMECLWLLAIIMGLVCIIGLVGIQVYRADALISLGGLTAFSVGGLIRARRIIKENHNRFTHDIGRKSLLRN